MGQVSHKPRRSLTLNSRETKQSTEGGTCRWGVPGDPQQAIKEPTAFSQGGSTNTELSSGQIQTNIKLLHLLPASKAALPWLQRPFWVLP